MLPKALSEKGMATNPIWSRVTAKAITRIDHGDLRKWIVKHELIGADGLARIPLVLQGFILR